MRLVLIQSPVQDFYETKVRLQPLGLAYLKAAVEKYHPDVEVVIRDYHSGAGRKTIRWPKEFDYLRSYYAEQDRGPFSTFFNYFHFGWSFAEIEADLRQLNPTWIGISSLFTPYYREALAIAKCARRATVAPTIFGGSHVSAAPHQILGQPEVDYVIQGEGERPLVELISYFKGLTPLETVSNLGYKLNGESHWNCLRDNYSLDEIPLPSMDEFPLNRYTYEGKPIAFLITSRSCPHKCSFCSVHLTFGNRYRRRSVTDVVHEIKTRYDQGYRVIDFEDDNLTFYKDEMKELCRSIIAIFPHRQMQLVAMNGISYLSLDDELLELMWAAGFTHLNLALVTSDQSVRETTKRPHTIEAYLRVVEKAHSLGFQIVSYQILGLPNESLDSMIQTLGFNARQPVLLGASIFYRTPGSPIAQGLELTEDDFFKARTTAMAIETAEVSRAHLYTMLIATRILDYLKGLPLPGESRLSDLLQQDPPEIGVKILRDLFTTGRLRFLTSQGSRDNLNFCTKTFTRILVAAQSVTTLRGSQIVLDVLPRHQEKRDVHNSPMPAVPV
ncbi:MAG: radical SAM protein [Bdellovibrionales bacterium]|nr:radical SAM protein [Bdellovibrionales bacterium]